MNSKRKRSPDPETQEIPTALIQFPTIAFQTLISTIQSPQGLKVPLLKRLYARLVSPSLSEPLGRSNIEGNAFGIELKCEDIQCLVRCLFKELDRGLQLLFSVANRDDKHNASDKDMPPNVDELTLLLRCCICLTTADQSLIMETTRYLLSVFGNLISLVTSRCEEQRSVNFPKVVSCESTYANVHGTYVSEDVVASLRFLELSDPWHPILCALLEIFADELIIRKLLRKYFMVVDSASCPTERLFNHLAKSDVGIVLEVISIHFILSVYDEPAFENFSKRFYLQFSKHFRSPELSLTAALPLLLNPIMLSAPKMLQTHLILLVSEAIEIDKNIQPELRHLDCYLTAFERSVALYSNHMSSSLTDHLPLGVNFPHANSSRLGSQNPTFESCIGRSTREKINDRVTKLESLRHLKKSDLMAGASAYIKGTQHIFEEWCQKDILSVLLSIIQGSLSCDVNGSVLYKKGNSSQDTYLLASILKLMSCSLFKAIWCLRKSGSSGCSQTLEDASSFKAYGFIIGIIGCFSQFDASLPDQKFLSNKMKSNAMLNKPSKWMLLHFSGLLSFSFATGIDFLVKGCISVIMALLNLYVFEGGIIALRSLVDLGTVSLSSDKFAKPVKKQNSTKKVASKFHHIQKVYLRKLSVKSFDKKSEGDIGETSCFMSSTREVPEETCDGQMYLNCKLGAPQKSVDDLADFIECKPGKDYSSWLKNRDKYRLWKLRKDAVVRWERKIEKYRIQARNCS